MRGYFGIGIDGATKTGNMGNLIRTAYSFGAAYAFITKPQGGETKNNLAITKDFADTSKTWKQIPFYMYQGPDEIQMPKGCRMVGVELTDESIDLPSFRHPHQAVYVLGAEIYGLSKPMLDRCDDVIKIPTQFSLNVATAGAIVMYDRMRMLGGFPDRPIMTGQPIEEKTHIQGGPKMRALKNKNKQEE
ncbi:RNA methyltransferase [Temperatibacter marinus]|uniref:RNA methyltransferase n=1 Tax=Temperatibacter marinus TaxID=1456591 RepID=A0AA52HAT7_9PROT|nr:RNA methyltransferase [Temperatibacter marinus]WND03080.1 RNA methyltransferase [Temperatibacter marinus]